MIREIQLSTADSAEDLYHEPPTGVLHLEVIGGDAILKWQPHHWPPEEAPDKPKPAPCEFQVPARSLLLALHAATEDDEQRLHKHTTLNHGPTRHAPRDVSPESIMPV